MAECVHSDWATAQVVPTGTLWRWSSSLQPTANSSFSQPLPLQKRTELLWGKSMLVVVWHGSAETMQNWSCPGHIWPVYCWLAALPDEEEIWLGEWKRDCLGLMYSSLNTYFKYLCLVVMWVLHSPLPPYTELIRISILIPGMTYCNSECLRFLTYNLRSNVIILIAFGLQYCPNLFYLLPIVFLPSIYVVLPTDWLRVMVIVRWNMIINNSRFDLRHRPLFWEQKMILGLGNQPGRNLIGQKKVGTVSGQLEFLFTHAVCPRGYGQAIEYTADRQPVIHSRKALVKTLLPSVHLSFPEKV